MAAVLTTPSGGASKLTISPTNPKQLKNSTLQFTASVNGEVVDAPTRWSSSNIASTLLTVTVAVVPNSISPRCSSAVKPVTAGWLGKVRVAVLGSNNLDVNQIDPTSLKLYGASPLNIAIQDINGDGKADLAATFDTSALRLHPRATVARLTGWLRNGQSFSGEYKIRVRVVPGLTAEDPSCR